MPPINPPYIPGQTVVVETGGTWNVGANNTGNFFYYTGTGDTVTFDAVSTLQANWFIEGRNTGNGILILTPNGTDLIENGLFLVVLPNEEFKVFASGGQLCCTTRLTGAIQAAAGSTGRLYWDALRAAGRPTVLAVCGDSTSLSTGVNANMYSTMAQFNYPGGELENVTVVPCGNNGWNWQTFLALTGGSATNSNIGYITQVLKPDAILLCYGVNNARLSNLTQAQLQAYIIQAVNIIRAALPNCAIILRTPTPFLSTDPGSTGYVVIPNYVVSNAVDNGRGQIRLTLNTTTALYNSNTLIVASVGGVSAANGTQAGSAAALTVTAAALAPDGLHVRLTVNTAVNVFSGYPLVIAGVSTEANGTHYDISVINNTTIDLTDTLYANAFSGSGTATPLAAQPPQVIDGTHVDLPVAFSGTYTSGGSVTISLATASQNATTALQKAYASVRGFWPNVTYIDPQEELFGTVCQTTSVWQGDILHPNSPGYQQLGFLFARKLSGRAPFSQALANYARAEQAFLGSANPWAVYAREVEDPQLYDVVLRGFAQPSAGASNLTITLGVPQDYGLYTDDTTLVIQGDIYVVGGDAPVVLTATPSQNLTPGGILNQTQWTGVSPTFPTSHTQLLPFTVYRPKAYHALDIQLGTQFAITGISDNGGGKVRLAIGAGGVPAGIGGTTIYIQGTQGGPSVSGYQVATYVSATQIDLLSVNYSAGYTTGGEVTRPNIRWFMGKTTSYPSRQRCLISNLGSGIIRISAVGADQSIFLSQVQNGDVIVGQGVGAYVANGNLSGYSQAGGYLQISSTGVDWSQLTGALGWIFSTGVNRAPVQAVSAPVVVGIQGPISASQVGQLRGMSSRAGTLVSVRGQSAGPSGNPGGAYVIYDEGNGKTVCTVTMSANGTTVASVAWTVGSSYAALNNSVYRITAPASITKYTNASFNISGAITNGAGGIRLTIGNSAGLLNGQTVFVSGVVGTTEANGTWLINVIDSTHIDLLNVAFSTPYVSGGTCSQVPQDLLLALDII